jgi:radical SAM protein with 4Fe4S-binding SPASM domain
MLFYRLHTDSFIREIGPYGYVYSQLTKHDRTYDASGRDFLFALSRQPQSFDDIFSKIAVQYSADAADAIRGDLRDFLQSLEDDRYVVSGETAAEIDAREPRFNYAENPKTATINFLQNADDVSRYPDTTEVLLAEYLQKPRIHHSQIELTSHCNERCIHCYIPHELKVTTLPFATVISIFDQLHELGTLGLTLSGGEALAHPRIKDILLAARERDFSITLLTNLTLLKPDLVAVIKAANVSLVQTSLYSTVAAEHDHITKLPGSFAKTTAALEALIAAQVPVQIGCPVMRTNFKSYKDVLRYAREHRCKAQTDYIMMARYDFSTDNLSERLNARETEELIRDVMANDADYNDLTETPFVEAPREVRAKQAICGVGRDNLCVASNGVVYPCSGWQGMALGNVHEQSIKDIWEKSPRMQELRGITKGSIPQCLDCADRQFCAPCLVRNFNESNGDYLKVNPHFCQAARINRRLVEERREQRRKVAACGAGAGAGCGGNCDGV